MKKILIIALLFVNILGYSQNYRKVTVREELVLSDSSVKEITTGDTLATKEWTIANAAILTGNPTEIFYNSAGILGSSPLFTYNPLDSTLTVDLLELANGEKISWNSDRYTIDVPSGLGWTNQVGQELNILVYNNSGSPISNGTAVYPNGTFNGTATLGLGQSNSHETIGPDYGLTTTSLDDNSYGGVVWFGEANDLNTSSYSLGDTMWISATNAGEITNVKPDFPNYAIQIGIVFKIGTTDGIIFVTSRSTVDDTFQNFWNGTIRENFDFLITATGGVITGTLSPTNGHPDLTLIFSDGFTAFDTSPSATITLTAGTNDNPQWNYIYIPLSTKLLTVSTSGFPTAEHKAIAKIYLKSADFVEKYKATINQNINDPVANTTTSQGQLSAITKRIRLDHAKHISGTEGVSTVVTAPTPDDVWISITEGRVSQLNEHTFPAFDTQIGDSLLVSNHFTNPDTMIGNINELLNDALGNTLNNRSFSVVVYGVMNKTGEPSPVYLNLPVGSYDFVSPQNAVSDGLNYSVYNFPTEFTGVGFLVARFTYTYKNDVWVLYDTEDLTGYTPNTSAGGGAGGTGVKSYLALDDTPSSYTAYTLQVANAGATALETATGITYNDSLVVDGNIHADTIKASGRIGIGTTTPLSALHIDKGIGDIENGLSFEADGNSGIYPSAADQIKIKLGGSVKTIFSTLGIATGTGTHGVLWHEGATATTPAHVFWGDFDTGIGRFGADAGSLIAGGKEIARFVENVTEQLIINPQGDLTGTAANPSLAFGGGGIFNTGLYETVDNTLGATFNGSLSFKMNISGIFSNSTNGYFLINETPSATNPNIAPNQNDSQTGVGWNATGELSLIGNSIEAMRLTEDSVYADSIIVANSGIKFSDGTIQTTAGGSVSFGTDGQIPFMNAGGTDFNYSAVIAWDGTTFGISGSILSTATTGIGVRGNSTSNAGIWGQSSTSTGVYGNSTTGGIGVWGNTTTNKGVYGLATSGIGVNGRSATGIAGLFENDAGNTSNIIEAKLDGDIQFSIDKDGGITSESNSTINGGLTVTTTTSAFIVPRMTTTQRTTLTGVNGMIVYDTTLNAFYFYENSSWVTK